MWSLSLRPPARAVGLIAAVVIVGAATVIAPATARAASGPVTPAPKCTTPDAGQLASSGWLDEPGGGTHFSCSYSTQGLTRSYWVYEPDGLTAGAPLMVVLHGCTEQGPDAAYISGYDALAAAHDFAVVYPNQADYTMTSTTTFDGNGSHCWNWFLPQGQARGAGEPALIAGITQTVAVALQSDPQHVHVIGVSAGGAMADIMAATYPDVYASTAILAGCEYMGLPCLGSTAAQPPLLSGQEAYAAATDSSGNHARVVPFLVENGDADTVVPVGNAIQVMQQWQVTDAYAANHGSLPAASTVPSGPCASQEVVPSPAVNTTATPPYVYNPYTVTYYSPDGSACPAAPGNHACDLGELYIVHGEEHAWPGGPQPNVTPTTGQVYTNPGGPGISAIAYRFFMAHPMTPLTDACSPSANVPEVPLPTLLVGVGVIGPAAALGRRRARGVAATR